MWYCTAGTASQNSPCLLYTSDVYKRQILWREFRIAILCGGTLALCNFAKLIFLDGIAAPVAAVVCLTLVSTVILSQLIGGLLPVVAEKMKMDPAVMASPLITTIVDTTTLLVYFNIARMLLKI